MIVITGSPGVGKHTVARGLSERTGLGIADINRIARDAGLVEESGGVDAEELQKILCRCPPESVMVGHLAPYVLERDMVKTAIVLRRSPYELLEVYRNRGYSDQKSMENAGSEVLGITAHDAADRFGSTIQINVTGKSVQKVTSIAESALSGNAAGEEVDWLGMVGENGDLARFFAD